MEGYYKRERERERAILANCKRKTASAASVVFAVTDDTV